MRRLVDGGMRLLGGEDGPAGPRVEAVSSMWPCKPSGSPTSWRSQSRASSSSSVAAGDVRQSIAFTLSAAASSSARIPGSLPEIAK
jgi:hypothetical protein